MTFYPKSLLKQHEQHPLFWFCWLGNLVGTGGRNPIASLFQMNLPVAQAQKKRHVLEWQPVETEMGCRGCRRCEGETCSNRMKNQALHVGEAGPICEQHKEHPPPTHKGVG